MGQINPKVLEAINEFVSQNQSFISLDIYCLLGIRIEDDENPIHQQVRDAFVLGLMPNYLSEWTNFSFEGGGYAYVWRYYLPKLDVKIYPLVKTADGRLELTRESLGHFPLLDDEVGLFIDDEMIRLELNTFNSEMIISDMEKRIRLSKAILQKAGLSNKEILIAKVYPTKIEITGSK